jgi:hypothetical protein
VREVSFPVGLGDGGGGVTSTNDGDGSALGGRSAGFQERVGTLGELLEFEDTAGTFFLKF